ncbi:Imm32 family immunity protein, partial [Paraglaciecola arctica]|uniref:Imm32 family immunity protein n=1 Tax=Paraglaciecola arctica TaxID=1128911 RepID=UPI001C07DE71
PFILSVRFLMKEVVFSHKFVINKNGIPFSEKEHCGCIDLDVNSNTVYLSGNKDGLLALASKLVEVANCDVDGYHKHLDEVELPNVLIKPDGVELNIGKSKG